MNLNIYNEIFLACDCVDIYYYSETREKFNQSQYREVGGV